MIAFFWHVSATILSTTYCRTTTTYCSVKGRVMDSEFLLKECQIADKVSHTWYKLRLLLHTDYIPDTCWASEVTNVM